MRSTVGGVIRLVCAFVRTSFCALERYGSTIDKSLAPFTLSPPADRWNDSRLKQVGELETVRNIFLFFFLLHGLVMLELDCVGTWNGNYFDYDCEDWLWQVFWKH